MRFATGLVFVFGCAIAAGCSSGDAAATAASEGAGGPGGADASTSQTSASSTSGSSSSQASSSSSGGGGGGGANAGGGGQGGAGGASGDTLDANRDRLLDLYFEHLKAHVTTAQSNGLSGAGVTDVCDVWTKLQPSARDVFLTLTARLQGSRLRVDGSSMLAHIDDVYRVVGGDGATTTAAGACGGSGNRMIMSMDAMLHDAQVAASDHQGARQSDGLYDIADAPTGTFWRDSHDLGGAHAPFDASDETDAGAPRGQTQYFRDPTSAAANAPLGAVDVEAVVDPYALELDQDYDCIHNSNPDCSYTTYGPLCFPMTSEKGTKVFTDAYGDFEPSWKPSGCP